MGRGESGFGPESGGGQGFWGRQPGFRPSDEEVAARCWRQLADADGSGPAAQQAADQLTRLRPAVVDTMAGTIMTSILRSLWSAGWQPAEVRRWVRSSQSALAARFTEVAILAFHDGLSGTRLDPRWSQQLASFGQRQVSTAGPWVQTWRQGEHQDHRDALLTIGGVIGTLQSVPVLDPLMPAPGVDDKDVVGASGTGTSASDPKLERIRGLLSKAESTEFEDEAIALTAKAQELMTRYAIDHEMVAAAAGAAAAGDGPRITRVPIDPPYFDAKSTLLAAIGQANRCRTIALTGLDMCTVIGFPGDLELVEMLFTSLLVQAQNSIAVAGQQAGRRTRSPSFRASFFVGYAGRIGERLAEATTSVIDELAADNPALPVLRSRDAAVDDVLDERYGDTLSSSSVRGAWDAHGIGQGRMAADRARLDSGELAG